MATYYEFKQIVGRFFGCRITEENDDDISVCLQGRYREATGENYSDIVIQNSELRELYDRVNALSNENMELFSKNSYELAIDLDYPMLRREQYPIISEDTTNGIKYTLGFPSIEYCAFLLMSIADVRNNPTGQRVPFLMPFNRSLDNLRRFVYDEQPLNLHTLLPLMIRELSLKIEASSAIEIATFRKYKTSFFFQFMYRSSFALVEIPNIDEMFHLTRASRGRIDYEQLNTPPLREYLDDVVDYYKMALSTPDPYTKFISFYHIMEYFYDEVFRKKMIADIKERITNPGFSYKDDEKIYEIALFVKHRLKMNDESGQGNELETLKFVLNEFVPIDELKNRIFEIDSMSVDYYQSNRVAFCNAPAIPWIDVQGVYTLISKRIYFVRNSLVHSKSGKNRERYKPYKDEAQLQKEIPLVLAIAELIIINSSSIL